MRVVVLVPDRDVVRTRVGDPAVVLVDALDDRPFTGILARIARCEDAERLMRVEIDLRNPEGLLCDGMYGRAAITLGATTGPSLCLRPASSSAGPFPRRSPRRARRDGPPRRGQARRR